MLIDVRWLQFIFEHWGHQGSHHQPQAHGATAG